MAAVPVIDLTALRADPDLHGPAARAVAFEIDSACRSVGFFTVTGHGVARADLDQLLAAARRFFALPEDRKARIAMEKGGRAWRGWFPLDGELTSGVADRKEGLYLGEDLDDTDPRVRAGWPLHGPNLLPDADVPELRAAVDTWLAQVTGLGHLLVRAIGVGLGLGPDWFDRHLTAQPTLLLRLFRYPTTNPTEVASNVPARPGVGEHTDYGLLTILAHDGRAGLQVRTPDGWQDVAAVEDAFVVNLGDMLDRMTGGRYRSTPHRVRAVESSPGSTDRISVPFFFDPGWTVVVAPLPLSDPAPDDDAGQRWDHTSVHDWRGTYGEYLTAKVTRVFPALGDEVLS